MAEKLEPSDFAGWASFKDPVKSITIFGNMEGIMFSYWNDKPDVTFGNANPYLKAEVQRLTSSKPRITCIATSRSSKEVPTLKVSSIFNLGVHS